MATASQITVSGNKKISTLQKEFSAKFPYLGINFFSEEEWAKSQRGEIVWPLRADQTIASVRTKVHPEPLSIHGRTKVATLEKNFLEQYGMYCQVIFRKKGETKFFYTSGDQDQYSLTDFNRKLEASGEYLQMT
jgi:hypothetical protein